MRIPNVPKDRMVDENGFVTDHWNAFFSNLVAQLSANLSDEGYVLPSQSDANILLLNTVENKSRVLYNATTEKAMVNNDGTFKEIQTL